MKKQLLSALLGLLSAASFAQVNINTANINELTALPNIGQAKAQAIIDYRDSNGDFASVEDLKKVKGIGEKIFDRIKEDLTIEGETDLSQLKSTTKTESSKETTDTSEKTNPSE